MFHSQSGQSEDSNTRLGEKMNYDTIRAGETIECRVAQVNSHSLFLEYWKPRTKWWHSLLIVSALRTSQFGVILCKDTSEYKENDKVLVSLELKVVKE